MSSHPPVLLLDDGELGLVRALLEDIGTEFWHLRGSKAEPPLPDPRRLLITTAKLAVSLPVRRVRRGNGTDPVWMAFVQGESKTQRQLLRRAGFDFLIPESVHPAALRLMMMRAVYDGANTQDVERVAFGDEIRFGTKLRTYAGVMIDVSPRGCRFLTRKAPKIGSRISIQIPAEAAGGRALSLDGLVTRAQGAEPEGGEPGEVSVGVRFRPMKRPTAIALKEVLSERQIGPRPRTAHAGPGPLTAPTLALGSARPFPAQTQSPAACDEGPPSDPQLDTNPNPDLLPRARFENQVEAFCAGATRLLVGRDLSEKGMLVEPNARMKVGERVRLFLHGSSREEPMLIEAHVSRDDGERGLALAFDWLEPEALERLRRLVHTLPKVHRLVEDTPTHTAVFAQLLPRLKRTA